MNESNFVRQRESDNSYCESSEQDYANYRSKNLPEGYKAYKETGQDVVYDRYDSDYEAVEKPVQEEKTCSCLRKSFC